jgi:signal peptidase II
VAVLWITVLVVLFDQFTKILVKGSPWSFLPFTGMPYGSSLKFIDDIVRITYIENAGIAFGINIPGFKVVFAVFSIVASIAILIYLKRNLYRLRIGERVALALILGGAVGNLIDRVFYGVFYHEQPLFYGRVVDFVDFGYKKNWFPVFNVADSCVTIGVGILIFFLMRHKSQQTETTNVVVTNDSAITPTADNNIPAEESHSS